MTATKTEDHQTTKGRRRPLIAVALGVVLAGFIAIPILFGTGGSDDPVAETSPEDAAVQTAEDFFAALARGEAEEALSLMEADVRELAANRHAVEFFASLPGTKTLSDCTTTGGPDVVGVRCTTNYNGPLMQAVAERSTGTFTVSEGQLTAMFIPGARDATASAFFEYASQTEPEAFDQACNPDSYETGSVRVQSSGFAFAGPCGELWAQVAEDAAAWVVAGRPPLSPEAEALESVEEFVAALTNGDAAGALALMGAAQRENPEWVNAVEFLAAIPGEKSVSECVAGFAGTSISQSCTLTIDGPLFQATGNATARASFTTEDGFITNLIPGSRSGADVAFVEYATQTRPQAFDEVCNHLAYEPGSVRVNSDGFVFTGACGELWAQVAEDAAAWVDAGQPDLSEQ